MKRSDGGRPRRRVAVGLGIVQAVLLAGILFAAEPYELKREFVGRSPELIPDAHTRVYYHIYRETEFDEEGNPIGEPEVVKKKILQKGSGINYVTGYDENGDPLWGHTETTIVRSRDPLYLYEVTKAPIQVGFKAHAGGRRQVLFSMGEGELWLGAISVGFYDSVSKRYAAFARPQVLVPVTKGNTLVYQDIFPEMDLVWRVEPMALHADLVLKSEAAVPDPGNFGLSGDSSFLVLALAADTDTYGKTIRSRGETFSGFHALEGSERRIDFVNSRGKILHSFVEGRAFEESGVGSVPTFKRLYHDGSGSVLLEGVSYQWLVQGGGESRSRRYPIRIDPVLEVSGTSSGNEVWERGLTVYVSSAYTVSSDDTLVIEPGCIVKLNGGTSVELKASDGGRIIAQGRPRDYAVFTKATDENVGEDLSGESPTAGEYGHAIRLDETADLDSVVQYCKVGYADTGVLVSASLELPISHNVFRECDTALRVAASGTGDNAENTVFNNLVIDCTRAFHFCGCGETRVSAYHNTVYDATNLGIDVSSWGGSATTEVTLANNLITSCSTGIEKFTSSGGVVTFSDCTDTYFWSNDADIVNATYSDVDGATIEYNPYDTSLNGDCYLIQSGTNALVDGGSTVSGVDLSDKTTTKPAEYVDSVTSETTWSKVGRDTGTPDVGYHYEPCDILIRGTGTYCQLSVDEELTVDPGVCVTFWRELSEEPTEENTARMAVYGPDGSLSAVGSATEPILFTSISATSDKITTFLRGWRDGYDWFRIDPYDSDQLEWCDFFAGYFGLFIYDKEMIHPIENCRFYDMNRAIRFRDANGPDTASAVVRNCLFRNCSKGVKHEYGGALKVQNCTFYGYGRGIWIDPIDVDHEPKASVENSIFTGFVYCLSNSAAVDETIVWDATDNLYWDAQLFLHDANGNGDMDLGTGAVKACPMQVQGATDGLFTLDEGFCLAQNSNDASHRPFRIERLVETNDNSHSGLSITGTNAECRILATCDLDITAASDEIGTIDLDAGTYSKTNDFDDFQPLLLEFSVGSGSTITASKDDFVTLRTYRTYLGTFEGSTLNIRLPALSVTESATPMYLWVAEDGSTYYASTSHAPSADEEIDQSALFAMAYDPSPTAQEDLDDIYPGGLAASAYDGNIASGSTPAEAQSPAIEAGDHLAGYFYSKGTTSATGTADDADYWPLDLGYHYEAEIVDDATDPSGSALDVSESSDAMYFDDTGVSGTIYYRFAQPGYTQSFTAIGTFDESESNAYLVDFKPAFDEEESETDSDSPYSRPYGFSYVGDGEDVEEDSLPATFYDKSGNTEEASLDVVPDSTDPINVAITAPAAGSQVQGATTVIGTATDEHAGIDVLKFFLEQSGAKKEDLGEGELSGGEASIVWKTWETGAGTYDLIAGATDRVSNATESPTPYAVTVSCGLHNGGFETFTQSAIPEGWIPGSNNQEAAISEESSGRTGKAVLISATYETGDDASDNYIYQGRCIENASPAVDVSLYYKVEGSSIGRVVLTGYNGSDATSRFYDLYDTGGVWRQFVERFDFGGTEYTDFQLEFHSISHDYGSEEQKVWIDDVAAEPVSGDQLEDLADWTRSPNDPDWVSVSGGVATLVSNTTNELSTLTTTLGKIDNLKALQVDLEYKIDLSANAWDRDTGLVRALFSGDYPGSATQETEDVYLPYSPVWRSWDATIPIPEEATGCQISLISAGANRTWSTKEVEFRNIDVKAEILPIYEESFEANDATAEWDISGCVLSGSNAHWGSQHLRFDAGDSAEHAIGPLWETGHLTLRLYADVSSGSLEAEVTFYDKDSNQSPVAFSIPSGDGYEKFESRLSVPPSSASAVLELSKASGSADVDDVVVILHPRSFVNGDLELVNEADSPPENQSFDYWIETNPSIIPTPVNMGAQIDNDATSGNVYSGKYGARISNNSGQVSCLAREIPIPEPELNGAFRLTFWYKTDVSEEDSATTEFRLFYYATGASTPHSSDCYRLQKESNWTHVELTCYIPQDATDHIVLAFCSPNEASKSLWIDQVDVTFASEIGYAPRYVEVRPTEGTPTPIIVNGSFETPMTPGAGSFSGWKIAPTPSDATTVRTAAENGEHFLEIEQPGMYCLWSDPRPRCTPVTPYELRGKFRSNRPCVGCICLLMYNDLDVDGGAVNLSRCTKDVYLPSPGDNVFREYRFLFHTPEEVDRIRICFGMVSWGRGTDFAYRDKFPPLTGSGTGAVPLVAYDDIALVKLDPTEPFTSEAPPYEFQDYTYDADALVTPTPFPALDTPYSSSNEYLTSSWNSRLMRFDGKHDAALFRLYNPLENADFTTPTPVSWTLAKGASFTSDVLKLFPTPSETPASALQSTNYTDSAFPSLTDELLMDAMYVAEPTHDATSVLHFQFYGKFYYESTATPGPTPGGNEFKLTLTFEDSACNKRSVVYPDDFGAADSGIRVSSGRHNGPKWTHFTSGELPPAPSTLDKYDLYWFRLPVHNPTTPPWQTVDVLFQLTGCAGERRVAYVDNVFAANRFLREACVPSLIGYGTSAIRIRATLPHFSQTGYPGGIFGWSNWQNLISLADRHNLRFTSSTQSMGVKTKGVHKSLWDYFSESEQYRQEQLRQHDLDFYAEKEYQEEGEREDVIEASFVDDSASAYIDRVTEYVRPAFQVSPFPYVATPDVQNIPTPHAQPTPLARFVDWYLGHDEPWMAPFLRSRSDLDVILNATESKDKNFIKEMNDGIGDIWPTVGEGVAAEPSQTPPVSRMPLPGDESYWDDLTEEQRGVRNIALRRWYSARYKDTRLKIINYIYSLLENAGMENQHFFHDISLWGGYLPMIDLTQFRGVLPGGVPATAELWLQTDPYPNPREKAAAGGGRYAPGFNSKITTDLAEQPVSPAMQSFPYKGNFQPKDLPKLVEWCNQSLRSGSKGVGFFDCFWQHDYRYANGESGDPLFNTILDVGRAIDDVGYPIQTMPETKTAIFHSYDAHFASGEGALWGGVYAAYSLVGHEAGYWFDFICEADVVDSTLADDYDVVYVPWAPYEREKTVKVLQDFVEDNEDKTLVIGDPHAFKNIIERGYTPDAVSLEDFLGIEIGEANMHRQIVMTSDVFSASGIAKGDSLPLFVPGRYDYHLPKNSYDITLLSGDLEVWAVYPGGGPAIIKKSFDGGGDVIYFAFNPFVPEAVEPYKYGEGQTYRDPKWKTFFAALQEWADEECDLDHWRLRLPVTPFHTWTPTDTPTITPTPTETPTFALPTCAVARTPQLPDTCDAVNVTSPGSAPCWGWVQPSERPDATPDKWHVQYATKPWQESEWGEWTGVTLTSIYKYETGYDWSGPPRPTINAGESIKFRVRPTRRAGSDWTESNVLQAYTPTATPTPTPT